MRDSRKGQSRRKRKNDETRTDGGGGGATKGGGTRSKRAEIEGDKEKRNKEKKG